jgi:uncharacterized HAD superfamily protein
MNLGFDLDGVLYPWHENVWKTLRELGIVESSFEVYWDKEWIDMRENQNTLFMNFVNEPTMYSALAPYYGVKELLDKFKEDGHTIWYITQRPEHIDFITRRWVKRWRLPFSDNVIRVETSKKIPVVEKEIDLFVDDAIRHAEELSNYTKVILVRKPWNKEIQEKFEGVDTVLHIGEYINRNGDEE